ncbi:MAG: heavy-metal-associated domain-containing protein [Clostridiales bacterium]|nr:heavy-metal-associated domain-containing protein [Clostridiales bacterium]
MKSATIQLETLTCPSCMQKIEGALKSLDGIDKDTMKVLFNSSKVKVNFDEEKLSIDEIESAITKLGYEVIKTKVKQELIKRINLLKKNAKVNF